MKKPTLILIPILISILLIFVIIMPWFNEIKSINSDLTSFDKALYFVNAVIWWVVLFWGLHHLTFQIAALFEKSNGTEYSEKSQPRIKILYTTCDDFVEKALKSCLNQDYPFFEVIVCDDSMKSSYKTKINVFLEELSQTNFSLVRRKNRLGYKAGNLNNAVRKTNGKEEWILLVDADQILPEAYLSNIASCIPKNHSHIAYIQGAHIGKDYPGNSDFQNDFSPEIELFYYRDLNLRNLYGFVPLLGHGALIQKSVWEKIGGMPEVVSEDFAFALRASSKGYRGYFTIRAISKEAFPIDFHAFLTRIKKFSGGTSELIRKEVIPFFLSKSSFIKKWDFGLILLWYFMMPLVFLNSFLSSYVCSKFWQNDILLLHPFLPFLYTWMFLAVLSITISITKSFLSSFKYYCCTASLYTAVIPIASFQFIKHFFFNPVFLRTPKRESEVSSKEQTLLGVIIIGLLSIYLSIYWWSPFSPVLLGQGLACIFSPFYKYYNHDSFKGKAAKLLMFLPGFVIFLGLITMWRWNGFLWFN